MPPVENYRFGGGADVTVLHPLVLVAMLLTIALVFILPRRYIIVPLIASTFLIPLGQEILIGGLHFFVYRIIILAMILRMIATKFMEPEGMFGGRLDKLDLLFLVWAILRASAAVLLFRAGGMVVNQSAFLLDVIGGYFILRFLIRDEEDIYRAIRGLTVVAILISISMTYEKFHGLNPFGFLDGVRLESEVRGNTVRAQGPFQHEILAGCFGAVLVPMFFLLWKMNKGRILAVVGLIAATIIAFTSSSSTPLLAYGGGIFALCLWPLRKHMGLVRWATVGLICALSLVMKAPVWFLIARLDLVGGSSGYHRAMLVNDFIYHFRDWWLIGTKDNPTWGANMWDLCNEFVAQGQTGGLMTFLVFIAIFCVVYSRIGRARKAVEGDRPKESYFWILGCGIWAHMVAFFGISYFDQTRFLWLLSLAIVSAATAPYLAAATQPQTPPEPNAGVIKPWHRPLTPQPGATAQSASQRSTQPSFPYQQQWRPRIS
jgi:hypothetical protein